MRQAGWRSYPNKGFGMIPFPLLAAILSAPQPSLTDVLHAVTGWTRSVVKGWKAADEQRGFRTAGQFKK
jgi:hypothetical protein